MKMTSSQAWLNLKPLTPALYASALLGVTVLCGPGCERAGDKTLASQKKIVVTLLRDQNQIY